jgi:O-antigen ligase
MGAVLGMVLFSLTAPARKSGRIAVVIVLACVTVGSAVWLAGDILLIKEESVSQKRSQTYEVLEVFSGSPLLGKGLGYRYRDTMVPSMSGSSEALLEVSYPMILSSTGIVGLIFYVFIYGYYPGRCLLVRRQRETFMILFAALVSVLVAAVGNPYIWGGGLGLFLIAVMGALYELEQSSLRARQFAGEGRRVGGQISMVASP